MLTFYIAAGLIALVAALLMVMPLISRASRASDRTDTDAEVFRDQLAEIDRDLARGTIGEAEAEGARVEISRRLIAAKQRSERAEVMAPGPRGVSGMIAGILLMGVPAIGALVYLAVGVPGAEDQPFAAREAQTQLAQANRPSQAEAEAQITPEMRQPIEQDPQYVALVERLQDMMANSPRDTEGRLLPDPSGQVPDEAEGQRLLATGLMRLGRWVEARQAFDRLLELLEPPISAELHANHAEAMVLAAGGYVSPEAEQAISAALQADRSLPVARYYAGLALRQSGRLDQAIQVWEDLRQDSAPDSPYLEWLNMMLAETIQMRGGGPVGGPSQADIAASEEMDPEDRAVMIQGMVDRLAERLRDQGGSAQEWAQLIASHATLGQVAEAEQALIGALQAYPDGPDHDRLIAHAARMGIGDAPAPAPAAPGPTAEDIEAAQQMSAEDRAQMIQGMVQRLEDRLSEEGGEAEDWLRLINAYVQLGRNEDAARVYALAQTDLAGSDAAGFLRERALVMGVISE